VTRIRGNRYEFFVLSGVFVSIVDTEGPARAIVLFVKLENAIHHYPSLAFAGPGQRYLVCRHERFPFADLRIALVNLLLFFKGKITVCLQYHEQTRACTIKFNILYSGPDKSGPYFGPHCSMMGFIFGYACIIVYQIKGKAISFQPGFFKMSSEFK
jgi:hypothetical protein